MYFPESGLIVKNKGFTLSLSLSGEAPEVVVSTPHDGLPWRDFQNTFSERGVGTNLRDLHVWPIANEIFSLSSAKKVRIAAVRSLMPRRFVDVNRSKLHMIGENNNTPGVPAYKDPQFGEVYDSYHTEVKNFVERAMRFCPQKALLLDLHGFSNQPPYAPPDGYDIILGTGNRKTIFSNIDKKLARFLEENGYTVFLPNKTPITEKSDRLNGGYTVWHYSTKYGINAIQIEIGKRFRSKTEEAPGRKLAIDIATFLTKHYQKKT